MWQRQIHLVSAVAQRGARGGSSSIAAGCGSWITTKSYWPSRAARCRRPSRGRYAASGGSHSMSAPCNALWTAFVTAKNSSLPCMTCQSASMPTLAQQRHVRREQLRHATAVRGRVHVQHPPRRGVVPRARGSRRSRRRRRSRRSRRRAFRERERVRALLTPARGWSGVALRGSVGQSIHRWLRLLHAPTSSRAHSRRPKPATPWPRVYERRGSTTSASCPWPMVARARSTRSSPRVAARAVRPRRSRDRSASTSTPNGGSFRVEPRSSRWRREWAGVGHRSQRRFRARRPPVPES